MEYIVTFIPIILTKKNKNDEIALFSPLIHQMRHSIVLHSSLPCH